MMDELTRMELWVLVGGVIVCGFLCVLGILNWWRYREAIK